MKVVCDVCSKEFEVKNRIIKTEKVTQIIERKYFTCPKCKKKYVISYLDKEIKGNIKVLKKLKGKLLIREISQEDYEKEYKDILNRNNSLNARYKALYGR